jgi:DNA invertase Pin-like site-specific DNA recombinase
MARRFIAYYRVSTASQGASGLGLEAQRRAVTDYLAATGAELVGTFEEIESGKKDKRPALTEALISCRLTGARLVIAKLDRLSRDVAFLATLRKGDVDFVACDMPDANSLTIHILASVAQAEREAISARTKAALYSIKVRLEAGETYISRRSKKAITRLGNPKGLSVTNPQKGADTRREQATAFATLVLPTIRALQADGSPSLAVIAAGLNARHILTAWGNAWTPMAVKRVLDRAPLSAASSSSMAVP